MNRVVGNWQTTLAGIGVLLVTVGQFIQGDPVTLNDFVNGLIGAGFLASKDSTTGSAPGKAG